MPLTFDNPSFETANAGAPGGAQSWIMSSVASSFGVAAFSPAYDHGWEDFEADWQNTGYVYAFVPAELEAALFEGPAGMFHPVESFEKLWSNDVLRLKLTSLEEAAFTHGTLPAAPNAETFEGGWLSNELQVFSLGDGADITETFESGWQGNENYRFDYDPADFDNAHFWMPDPFADTRYESFEYTFREMQVVGAASTDLFTTSTPHGLLSFTPVTFRAEQGALPAPIVEGFLYYVVDPVFSPTQFAVEYKMGMSVPIDLTSDSTGRNYVKTDPVTGSYWTTWLDD